MPPVTVCAFVIGKISHNAALFLVPEKMRDGRNHGLGRRRAGGAEADIGLSMVVLQSCTWIWTTKRDQYRRQAGRPRPMYRVPRCRFFGCAPDACGGEYLSEVDTDSPVGRANRLGLHAGWPGVDLHIPVNSVNGRHLFTCRRWVHSPRVRVVHSRWPVFSPTRRFRRPGLARVWSALTGYAHRAPCALEVPCRYPTPTPEA